MCNLIAHMSVEEKQIFTLTSYTTSASQNLDRNYDTLLFSETLG